MTKEDLLEVKKIAMETVLDLHQKKIGDTPLEAFDLVNKNYVDNNDASMFMYNLAGGTVITTISQVDTFFQVPSGFSTSHLTGINFQNGREFLINNAGHYLCVWSMSPASVQNNQEIEGALWLNGVAQTASASHNFVSSANRYQSMSSVEILSLNRNDVLGLAVLNHTGANDIIMNHAVLSIKRVSG